ncbi:hypothetical protein [Shinella sp.]|uniref:hypothetical protein n=1 Tax=Shinella sp. TaxID=1870904 RepID=UPI004034F94D
MTLFLFEQHEHQQVERMQIQHVDSHTGSGKSFALRFVINPNSKAIIGTPRTQVSNEIAKELRELGIPVKVISGRTHANCTKAFRAAVKEGKWAAIIAHHSIVMRKHPGATEDEPCITADYDLYIDEAPKVDETITLAEDFDHLRDTFASILDAKIGVDVEFVELGYTTAVADILAKHKDRSEAAVTSYSPDYIRFCYARKDADYTVAVKADELRRYKNREDEGDEAGNLHFHLVKQPSMLSGYKSVTIMSAKFFTTEVYGAWRNKVDFVSHPVMSEKLRYSDFSHKKDEAGSGLVYIHYFSEEDMSWYAMQQIGYQHFLDKAADAFEARFGNVEHIFCRKKNKAKRGEEPFIWRLDSEHNPAANGIRLDPSAQGENGYQHINIALHLVPMNPPTGTFKFKKKYFGMESEDVKAAIAYNSQYQFVSRTGIRNFDSRDELHFFVLDKAGADELAKSFGPACAGEPQFFDIGIPELRDEKQEAKTAKERKAHQRKREKMEQNDHENTIQYDDFLFRQWANKADVVPTQVPLRWSEVVAYLTHSVTNNTLKSKSNSAEFREGFFKDLQVHTLKGNIMSAKLMLMDVDKATRDPAELVAFFKRNGISVLLIHSFSSTPLDPRFHLIIPMSEAVNQENYARIFNLLKADIEAAFGDAFEVEEKYFSFNQRMSIPYASNFKADLIIDGTVWKDVMTYTHSFLDVRFFLSERNQITSFKRTTPVETANTSKATDKSRDTLARDIIDHWAVTPGQGLGRKHFYNAGVDLKKAGFTYAECLMILAQNRQFFGHGQDRDAKAVADHVYSNSWQKAA